MISFFLLGCKNPSVTPTDTDIDVTPFENVPALKDMVLYEVNMRSFSEEGSFSGVTKRLDEIKELGVNVIWLMPIHPIGEVNSVNSPYSVKNYLEVHAEYGTIEELRSLVKEAHDRDIAVILDWVANHTAWDHPWVSEHADWYVKDANGDMIPPPGTDWKDVVELDYSNSAMRKEMIDAMAFWIDEVNIDGFRCDAVDFVPDDFWQQALNTLNSLPKRKLIFLAEGGKTSNFNAGFPMNYAWDFASKLENIFKDNQVASGIFTTNSNEFNAIPDGGEKLRYITNHDKYAWEGSPVNLLKSKEGALGAFVASAYMGGIPLIYAGQEIGYPNTISFFNHNPLDWSQNPDYLTKYKEVMGFRKTSSAVKNGDLSTFQDNNVIAFKRADENQEVLVLINTRDKEIEYTLPAGIQNTAWTNTQNSEAVTLGSTLTLQAFEFLIFEKL